MAEGAVPPIPPEFEVERGVDGGRVDGGVEGVVVPKSTLTDGE